MNLSCSVSVVVAGDPAAFQAVETVERNKLHAQKCGSLVEVGRSFKSGRNQRNIIIATQSATSHASRVALSANNQHSIGSPAHMAILAARP